MVLEILVSGLGLDSDLEKITTLIREASKEWGIFQRDIYHCRYDVNTYVGLL